MKRELKFDPIYKGYFNMTPSTYENMLKAAKYREVCAIKNNLKVSAIEVVLLLIASSYLIVSMFR